MITLRHLTGAALILLLAGGAYAQEEPPPRPTEDRAEAYNRGTRPPDKPSTPAGTPDTPSATDRTNPIWPQGKTIPQDEKNSGNAKTPQDEKDGDDKPSGPEKRSAEEDPGSKVTAPTKPARESDQEYAACRLALSHLGTVYEERPEITDKDNPACGIARPLHVTEILPGLTVEGGAIMRCDTARALGFWAQDFLRPASVSLPGSPRLTGLQLGTHYDCRARNGTGEKQPKLSEHALGNAVDIAAFVFDQGPPLPVEPRQDSGDLYEAFQRAARATACLHFSTVLGPGSNAAHHNHLHLDVIARKNGWRLCQ